ncbi:MAG TPA: hypothetical protein VG407_08500 [Caulobacteraceae bacterium]|nr:hypothetical protein [Caulobacteraceae bacterium]
MADASTPPSIDLAVFEARRLLQKPTPKAVSAWRGLGAAALAAFSALLLAGAVIFGPGGVGGSQHDQALSHWQP